VESQTRDVWRGGSMSGDRRLFGARPRTTQRRDTRRAQVGEAGPEVARPTAQQSGDRRLFGARPRTNTEKRTRRDQPGKAGPEVARPNDTAPYPASRGPLPPSLRSGGQRRKENHVGSRQ